MSLAMNPAPRTTKTGQGSPGPQPQLLPLDPVSHHLESAGRQEEEVRKRTSARRCYLGNSQSASRVLTNGKRRRADPASLKARGAARRLTRAGRLSGSLF